MTLRESGNPSHIEATDCLDLDDARGLREALRDRSRGADLQSGKLAIAPDVETWDLTYEQTSEVFDMAVDDLGATHVLWQSEFTSVLQSAVV